MSLRIPIRLRRLTTRVIAPLALTLGAVACSGESGNGTCSWLFAPSSFVDAGQPACIAEPAGSVCDHITERCPTVCPAGEYLLTCLENQVASLAIPEETLRDPVVGAERGIKCTATDRRDGAGSATQYCCQCGP